MEETISLDKKKQKQFMKKVNQLKRSEKAGYYFHDFNKSNLKFILGCTSYSEKEW